MFDPTIRGSDNIKTTPCPTLKNKEITILPNTPNDPEKTFPINLPKANVILIMQVGHYPFLNITRVEPDKSISGN